MVFAAESGTALPRGTVVDGFLEDTGRALFLVRGDGATTAALQLTTGGELTSVDLPGLRYGRDHQQLNDGSFALRGIKDVSQTSGRGIPVHRILRLRPNGELRKLWEWEDTSGCPELCPGISIAPDGEAWGLVEIDWKRWGGDEPDLWHYGLGDMRGEAKVDRTVSVQFEDTAMKRGPFWREDEGDVEEEFRWQWDERVLWAKVKNEWRAYHLWNLGLSETLDGPFWRVEDSAPRAPQRQRNEKASVDVAVPSTKAASPDVEGH